ncbi:MAG: DUF1080 domain-containing protein [Planctomycetota bacterium]|nr:DUF1080 domain-containing protein [Planctomycetota bacterium]MDA1214448.1 DUF1080 domain-containing protein [Planctomycetota bacterium]
MRVPLLCVLALCFSGCAQSEIEVKSPSIDSPQSSEKIIPAGANTERETAQQYPAAESTNGEFVPLSFNDFTSFPAEGNSSWTLNDGIWKTSGQPKGYFASNKVFGDFILRYEYRFPPLTSEETLADFMGNTGCLIYIDPLDKIWPVCLEVQGKYPETGSIKVNGRKDLTVSVEEFPEVRLEKLLPPGEWNQVEIVSQAGGLTVSLNGELISRSQPTELISGRIAFQAENYDVEFRNLSVQVP